MRDDAFRGRRGLVTGGSSGIGLATARALVRSGARVSIVARGEARLRAAAESLAREAGPPGRVHWTAADLADAAGAERAVAAAAEALGGLDLVVNNAGAALARRFEDTPIDEFRRLLDVNFLATVQVTRAALPHLLAAGGGDVANVSSLAGVLAIYGYAAYAPTKFAVTALSEVLRQELGPRGIRVAVLLPPDTDTPQLAEENRGKPAETRALAGNVPVLSADAVAASLLAGVARGRTWIVPGWRARVVVWLARHAPGLVRLAVDRDLARAARGSPGA